MKKDKSGKLKVELDLDEHFEASAMDVIRERLGERIMENMRSKIDTLVTKTINDLANKEFNKMAEEKLEEFFIKGITKTNSWGEKTGETTTLRDLLLNRFSGYMSEPVDRDGNTQSDPYRRNDSPTRSQWLLTKLAHQPLQEAIDKTVTGIAAKAKEQIQASVSRYIAEQLSPTINVPQLQAPK